MKNITENKTEKQEFKGVFMEFIGLRSMEFVRDTDPQLFEDLFSMLFKSAHKSAKSIKARFNIAGKAMTMRDIRRICRTERIEFSTIKPKGIRKRVL